MNSLLRSPVQTHLLSALIRRRRVSTRPACVFCGSSASRGSVSTRGYGHGSVNSLGSPFPLISRSKSKLAPAKLQLAPNEASLNRLFSHDIVQDPELLQALRLELEEGAIVRGNSSCNKLPCEKDLIDHELDEYVEHCPDVLPAAQQLQSIPEGEQAEAEPSGYLTFEPEQISPAQDIRLNLNSSFKRDKRKPNKKGVQMAAKKLKKEEREKIAKVKRSELEKTGKEVSFNKSLVSYLELCVFTGQVSKALTSLNFYRARGKANKQLPAVTSIAAFNCILHGFAAKGNYNSTREVFQLISADNLKPNPQSYAALLESYARAHAQTNSSQQKQIISDHIQDVLFKLEDAGYTTKDLFNHSIFAGNQREMVLAAIQLLNPSFKPVIEAPFPHYVCPLLAHLNDPEPNLLIQSPAAGLISQKRLDEMARRQLKTELHGSVTVKSIEIKENKDALGHYRNVLEETEKQWAKAIEDALKRNMNALVSQTIRQRHHRSISLHPFLKVLSPADCVKIMLQEIRKLAEGSETYSPSIVQLHRELGLRVLSRYEVMYKKQNGILNKVDILYREYCKWYLNPAEHGSNLNSRQKWQELLFDPDSTGPHVDIGEKVWPNGVLCSIGRFLYGIIMRDIKINAHVMKVNVLAKPEQLVPAFYSIFRMQGVHLKEEIKPHPTLVKLFQAASRDELTFDSVLVPMVCPPLPWASIRTGGYLLSAAKIVRLPYQAHQQRHRLEQCPPEDLYPALDSLNQLGCVPWKINEGVLDILIQVFNNKGDESLAVPPPPSECPSAPPIEPTMEKQEKFQIHKQRVALKRKKAEMYSLWCDALYRLSIANHFRKDIFWFPHNMDFRGRVYPCPPHLNHLGADTARAILVFASGQPLGPKGLDWLKIHLVNLTGLKKRDPLRDRLKYANDMLKEILDSADNPLTGRRWWTQSDEPWQTLACCIEISKAIRSGDPKSYICHFPIQQDGSCNGLQHYAALGRDQAGAESVNLSPCYTPQDVYSAVGALVEKLRQRDAANGVQIAQVLEGYIKRKVIKQTVMTTVYGVTRYGARLQIAKQLKDIPNFPKEHLWPASLYLVGRTFDSLQEMFTSTKEIQDWFTECARMISHVCGQNVEWVTPLGLPIVQPYFRQLRKTFDSHDPMRIKETSSFDMFERPNVMKQKNAFPPNYIHSLDSSHMMLTSLHCERANITYVSVHDCYWTHAKTVEIMNTICREQFVSLHSQPILEDLSDFLVKKYSYRESDMMRDGSLIDMSKNELNRILRAVPEKGSFDLKSVLQSVYFFS